MRNKPKCLKKEVVARSNLFEVEQLFLEFSNGEQRVYERLASKGHGAVLIIAMPDPQHIYLVSEYGAGTDAYELGFPKGRVEKGEAITVAADRELKEEVGLGAKQLCELKSLSLAPGYLGAKISVVLARDLYEEWLEGDEPEPLELIKWPLAKLDELLARDDFSEARSVAALLLLQQFLRQEP